MNPRNPTYEEVRQTEQLFLNHMQALSKNTAHPKLAELGWLKTFELQFSDRWLTA